MEARKQGVSQVLVLALSISLVFCMVMAAPSMAVAAPASVLIDSASTDQGAYAVDQSVTLNVKYAWEGLTSNVTVNLQLWNSTDMVEDLANYTVPYNVSGTLTPKGSEIQSYTPSTALTEEVGSTTYYLKLLSGGIVVDTEKITIVVSEEQKTLSVVWQDQNNDRVVDINELVTFTAYVNWAFIETAESHNLYVNYGDGEKLLSSVTITTGSGSQTVTDSVGFSSAGQKTATFTLKDSTGQVVATRTASVLVGGSSDSGEASVAPSSSSLVGMVTEHWQMLAIVVAILGLGYIYLGKKPKRRRR